MEHQAAQELSSVLSRIDRKLAEPATRPLERLVARPDEADSLIVAFVGPSGVGKSTLMNRLSGERVVTTGPLRPTTTGVTVWGDVSESYLPGKRASGPNLPDRLVLVDTPAPEHYPEAIAEVLDRVDVAILVVSPDRYADGVTAESMAAIAERGIPTRVVLSVGATGHASDELISDASAKLGVPVDLVVVDDTAPLLGLLKTMVDGRDELIRRRDEGAAVYAAIRASGVADRFAAKASEAAVVVDHARESFEQTPVDRRRLAATASHEWDVAAQEIISACRAAADDAIDAVATAVAHDDVASAVVASASVSLPEIDRRPIDGWHQTTTATAIRSVRHRHLHPRRWRAVRADMWRLSIDFDRRPSKRVRKALGGRLPDLRFASGQSLMDATVVAAAYRKSAFIAGLDPYASVTPDEIRSAADALSAAGSVPVLEADADE